MRLTIYLIATNRSCYTHIRFSHRRTFMDGQKISCCVQLPRRSILTVFIRPSTGCFAKKRLVRASSDERRDQFLGFKK